MEKSIRAVFCAVCTRGFACLTIGRCLPNYFNFIWASVRWRYREKCFSHLFSLSFPHIGDVFHFHFPFFKWYFLVHLLHFCVVGRCLFSISWYLENQFHFCESKSVIGLYVIIQMVSEITKCTHDWCSDQKILEQRSTLPSKCSHFHVTAIFCTFLGQEMLIFVELSIGLSSDEEWLNENLPLCCFYLHNGTL